LHRNVRGVHLHHLQKAQVMTSTTPRHIVRPTLRDSIPEVNLSKVFASGVGDLGALTHSPSARAASHADLAPQSPRPGSQDALDCPSRMGDELHYRDGRVTTLAGEHIHPQ
jgi:hypothetical protein